MKNILMKNRNLDQKERKEGRKGERGKERSGGEREKGRNGSHVPQSMSKKSFASILPQFNCKCI